MTRRAGRTTMGRPGRGALQRIHDHRLDASILDRARRAGSRLVTQPLHAMLYKAPPPFADRRFVHLETSGNLLVFRAFGAAEHAPSPQRERLSRTPPAPRRGQFAPFRLPDS